MTTTQTAVPQRIYPGVLDANAEFFVFEDQVQLISNGTTTPFNEIPYTYHQLLRETLALELEASAILKEWHPDSEFHQLRTFAKCRFGGLDCTPDILDNKLHKGDYWSCPNRGNCKGEGVVCTLPTYNGHKLTATDVQFIKLLSSDLTNEAIASQMDLPMGTFHQKKKRLYDKLETPTKQGVALIGVSLNIV